MNKKVAVLVVNYNSKAFLTDCFRTVLSQTFKDFDVFMIDNSSTDGSIYFVREKFPQVKIIKSPTNLGPARGFNLGIEKTINDYEYLLLANNDIVVEKNWLSSLLEPLEEDQRVGISTSLVFEKDGKIVDNAGGCIVNLLTGVFGGYLSGYSLSQFRKLKLSYPIPTFFGISTSMLVRSLLFKKIGIFNSAYFFYGYDLDLSWRALLSGYTIVCSPESIVYHYGSGTPKDEKRLVFILGEAEKNILLIMYRNLSFKNLLLFLPFTIVFRFLGSFLYLRISSKITLAKIRNIFEFLLDMRQFSQERLQIQKERKFKDEEIFRLNNVSIISFSSLLKLTNPWLATIRALHKNRRRIQ